MKYPISLILFVFSFFVSFSQQTKIDSLINEFNNEKIDTLKAKISGLILSESYYVNFDIFETYLDSLCYYSKKGNSLKYQAQCYRYNGSGSFRKNDYDNAIKYFKFAYNLFLQNNDTISSIRIISNIAMVYDRIGKIDSAKILYKKCIKKTEKSNKLIIQKSNWLALYNLGITYKNQGDYKNSIKYIGKSLEKAKKINDTRCISSSLYMLGTLYNGLGNKEKAKLLLKESLPYFEENQEYMFIAAVYNNLAKTIVNKDSINHQIKYFKEALKYSKKSQSRRNLSTFYNNLASIYIDSKKYKVASVYLDSAYISSVSTKNDLELGRCFLHRAKFFAQNNSNYKQAILSLLESKKVFEKINAKHELEKVFNKLVVYYKKTKNFEKALLYFEKLNAIKDSIKTIETAKEITEIETKYQTEKKEKENLKLKKEKAEQIIILQKEKQQKTYFITALIAALLFILVFAYFFRRNKKQKILIENLQKELHHRIKNNLSVIDTFIEVAKEEFDTPAFNNKLTELQNRIAGINEVHKQLYNSKDITSIHLKKYINTLADNIANSFNNDNVEVIQNIDNSLKLYTDKSFPVGLIINEFITNSFKYAFGKDVKGKINIKMQEAKNTFSLILSDNGKGLPEDFDIEQSETFGMRIMKLLTEQLKGTFQLESTNGVKINIQFPK